jgi:ABC-type proline/glycine betaine transport system substrate-binding protein
MQLVHVGSVTLTSAGGSAQTLTTSSALFNKYHFTAKLLSGSPAAGSTTVFCTTARGSREQVTFNGSALNIDPTAPVAFSINAPLESVDFTPSGWTAGVSIEVTAFAEAD